MLAFVVALAAALAFTRAALFTCPRLECLHVSDGWREVFDSTQNPRGRFGAKCEYLPRGIRLDSTFFHRGSVRAVC